MSSIYSSHESAQRPAPVRQRLTRALAVGSAGALAAATMVGLGAAGPAQAASYFERFDYTGEEQTWTVPEGIDSISIILAGGNGATATGAQGGGGAILEWSNVPVTPGQTCTLLIGQGGQQDVSLMGGGGGAGSRLLCEFAEELAAVAGGGGGGGAFPGGGGGTPDGSIGTGNPDQGVGPGQGGTSTAVGAGGVGAQSGGNGADGVDGVGGKGGEALIGCPTPSIANTGGTNPDKTLNGGDGGDNCSAVGRSGGGGGGGFYGGGGGGGAVTGGSAGGGGGSSVYSGLEPTYTVQAGSAIGPGADGYAEFFKEDSEPDAPSDLVAVPGYGEVTIEFTPGADGGRPITSYEYSLDGGVSWLEFVPPASGSPVTIPGLTNGVEYSVTLRAVNEIGPGPASDPVVVTPLGGVFVPVDPYRAYDSREDVGPLVGGQSRLVSLGEVPGSAVAVAYNVTVVGMVGAGYLTVTPGGTQSAPLASTINYSAAGQQWANGFVSGIDEAGELMVFAGGAATDFIVDVVGFYVSDAVMPVAAAGEAEELATSTFFPMTPVRAYDSRDVGAGGPLGNGAPRTVNVTAGGLVPPEATAVAYTLTETGTVGRGYLAVAPAGAPEPDVSSINWFTSNQTSANSSVVGIVDGQVDVYAGSSTGGSSQFVIDVLGFYLPFEQAPEGGRFSAIEPTRAYDSRIDDPAGPISGGGKFENDLGVPGVPQEAIAVAFNLTETGTEGSGFLTTTPAFVDSPPVASTINWWQSNQTIANGTVVEVPARFPDLRAIEPTAGVNTFAGGGSTQYVMDVAGYFHFNTNPTPPTS